MNQNSATITVPGWLGWLERAGNRLPHPTLLFVWLVILLWPLSACLAWLGWSGRHPATGELLQVRSLIDADGINYQITHLVTNFTGFAPLGVVLVAMLGIGIAERAGLLKHLLQSMTERAPDSLLVPAVAFAGVMSSMAADAGYVVLIPLAGLLFQQAGKPPLLGIAVAFAGVSGGFSANLLVGPVDALLAGLTTEAAQLVNPGSEIKATSNYWFIVASTVLVTLVVSLVAHLLARKLDAGSKLAPAAEQSRTGGRAMRAALVAAVAFTAALVLLGSEQAGILRQPGQALASSDFISHVVVLVALGFAVCGYVYGRVSGHFRNAADAITAMEDTMATMAGYLVLMFFAAQFVAAFAWSGIGSVMAVRGAGWLGETGISGAFLVIAAIFMAALINLLVGSASAKWAVLAPVLVPMLMLLGIPPEATQAAFRVGDSSTNIITPLMPYFALVLGFARQYQPDAGIGTLAAIMLPFSLALLISWTLLLAVWMALDWPLGF